MNTLFVAYSNMGVRNGGSICTKTFIDIFNDLSETQTLLLPQSAHYCWRFNEKNVIAIPATSFLNKILKLFFGSPHRFYTPLKKDTRIIESIDTVVLSGSILGSGIIPLVKMINPSIKIITIHHNYEPDYHRDNKTLVSMYGYKLGNIFKAEDLCLKQSDINMVLTQKNKEELIYNHKLTYQCNIKVIPAILNKDFILPTIPNYTKYKFVISGALGDCQTEKGILDFIYNYYTPLLKYFPQTRLIIAGRNPSRKLISIVKEKKIELIANPENLDDIIRTAEIFINPTKLGSGLKLRNIDPLKFGIPVVCQEKASSGYEELIGRGVFPYNSVEDFISALSQATNYEYERAEIQKIFYNTFSYQRSKDLVKTALIQQGFI